MNNIIIFAQSHYKKNVVLCLFLLMSTFSCLSQAADKTNIRGERYCEIVLSKALTEFEVYNTFGLNDCPAAVWNKITLAQVKKDSGSTFVHLNGPRYWVIDGFKNTTLVNSTPRTLGGLAMREAGVLHIGVMESIKAKVRSNSHYHQWRVERHTTWTYEAGKPIYELVDDQGNVYVMQSYSVQQHPQTEASLASLGGKLQLPAGWKFKTGVLAKQESVKAINNLAIVVQDNFLNTYQLATHDLLQG